MNITDDIMDWKDAMYDYETSGGSNFLILIENIIISLLFVTAKDSKEWGIGVFVMLFVLYRIPFINGAMGFLISLVETMMACQILKECSFKNDFILFASIVIFGLLVGLHMLFGSIRNNLTLGISLVIAKAVIIAFVCYFTWHSLLISIVLFFIISIISFIPVIRVAEYVILTLAASLLFYKVFEPMASQTPLIIGTGIVVIIQCILYAGAYYMLDYKGRKAQRIREKQEEDMFIEYINTESSMYQKYPQLCENNAYYKTCVCQNDEERKQFDEDWKKYIRYLASEKCLTFMDFNQFFDMYHLYDIHFYNREHMKEKRERKTEERSSYNDSSTSNNKRNSYSNESASNKGNNFSNYFNGCTTQEALTKRYRDLCKVYHPDMGNGSAEEFTKIQNEYESLKKKFS